MSPTGSRKQSSGLPSEKHSRGRFAETFARHTPEPSHGTVPVARMWTVMAGAATLALAMFVAGSVVSGGITLTSGVSTGGQAPDPGRNAAAVGAPGQANGASQSQSGQGGAGSAQNPSGGVVAPTAGTSSNPSGEQPLIALPSATPSSGSEGLAPLNTIAVQPPVIRTVTATPSTSATTASAEATATATATATAKAAAKSSTPVSRVAPAKPTVTVTATPTPTTTVTVTPTPTASATPVTTVTTTVTPSQQPTTERETATRERDEQGQGTESPRRTGQQTGSTEEKKTEEQSQGTSGEQQKKTEEEPQRTSGEGQKKTAPQHVRSGTGRSAGKTAQGVRLVSLASNKCVDAGKGTDGTPLTLQDCSDAPSQRWVFHQDGTIRSSTGLCMDVAMANTADGTTIQVANCNNGPAQRFSLQDGKLTYPAASGKCVDARANAPSLQLWGCADSSTQKWRKA